MGGGDGGDSKLKILKQAIRCEVSLLHLFMTSTVKTCFHVSGMISFFKHGFLYYDAENSV